MKIPSDRITRPVPARALIAACLVAVLLSLASVAGAPDAPFTLTNEARERGVQFVQKNFATEMKYPFETLGGAVAAFDYDDDGWVDLLFLNGAPSPEHVRSDPASFNRLFRNRGQGRFEDVTMASGLSGAGIKGYPQGVAIGDYDNDGHADVLVTNYGDNVLYHNEGNGRFTDATARAGVAMPRHPLKASAAFFDYDNDGWLDIFVTHYFQWTLAQNADDWCGRREKGYRIYCDPDAFQPLPNALLRNNRDGTFTDVSAKTGVDRFAGKGMGVAVADYDADGRMDVFVANDRFPHFLYHNEADGTFSEVGFTAGVSANESGTMVSGMGCDFKDFDGDGRPDIFVTDLVHDGFTLFVNQGKGLFVDHSFPSGIGRASAEHSGWSAKFLDIDNDGLKDVFSSGSHVVDNVALYNPDGEVRGGQLPIPEHRRGAHRGPVHAYRAGARGEGGLARAGRRGLRQRRHPRDGRFQAQRRGRPVREEGRGRGQLDPPEPGRVAQQPGRDRRPRAAGVALRPFALRARHDGERDLLGERQACALRVG